MPETEEKRSHTRVGRSLPAGPTDPWLPRDATDSGSELVELGTSSPLIEHEVEISKNGGECFKKGKAAIYSRVLVLWLRTAAAQQRSATAQQRANRKSQSQSR